MWCISLWIHKARSFMIMTGTQKNKTKFKKNAVTHVHRPDCTEARIGVMTTGRDSKTGLGQSAVQRINMPLTQAISIKLKLITRPVKISPWQAHFSSIKYNFEKKRANKGKSLCENRRCQMRASSSTQSMILIANNVTSLMKQNM